MIWQEEWTSNDFSWGRWSSAVVFKTFYASIHARAKNGSEYGMFSYYRGGLFRDSNTCFYMSFLSCSLQLNLSNVALKKTSDKLDWSMDLYFASNKRHSYENFSIMTTFLYLKRWIDFEFYTSSINCNFFFYTSWVKQPFTNFG